MTAASPSWSPYYPASRARTAEPAGWLHRCDYGPQRIMTSEMAIDLGGCPFCSGYPPDVTFGKWRTVSGDLRWMFIAGKPYPPPPTAARIRHDPALKRRMANELQHVLDLADAGNP